MRAAAAALGGRLRIARPTVALRAPSPRLRRRLAVLAAFCLLLAAGYQFWLRDSSLVAVDDVKVTGLTTKDAKRVRAALMSAGHSMTTLHVDNEALEQAVAHYPVVSGLEVRPDFPHGLRIHVIEHHPAAIARLGDAEVPVAGDGTLLRGLPVEGRLPAIEAEGGARGERLTGSAALGAARIAGAVPDPLRGRVERIEARRAVGLVAELYDGPELIFGDGSRARAKWTAAARVLADPDAEGATYIDLRLPGRPAAGGLPAATVAPVAPAGGSPAPGAATGAAGPATGAPTTAPGTGTVTPPATVTPATGTPAAGTPAAGTTPPAAGTPPAPTDGLTTQPVTATPAPAPTAPVAPQTPVPAAPGGTVTGAGGVGAPPG